MKKLDTFLISPVNNVSKKDKEACRKWVEEQEAKGLKVHWPLRDTKQDNSSLGICKENAMSMKSAKRVAIYWSPKSTGSIYDMGMQMAFWLQNKKPIEVINPEDVVATETKSFANLILEVNEENLWREARAMRRKSYEKESCERGAVGAVVVKNHKIISSGYNFCRAASEQKGCPRRYMPAGVSQELCGTVHAEVSALLNIREKRKEGDFGRCIMPTMPTVDLVIISFTEREMDILGGATLFYSGHHYSCANCKKWCELLGVEIRGDPLYTKKNSNTR